MQFPYSVTSWGLALVTVVVIPSAANPAPLSAQTAEVLPIPVFVPPRMPASAASKNKWKSNDRNESVTSEWWLPAIRQQHLLAAAQTGKTGTLQRLTTLRQENVDAGGLAIR